MSEVHRYKVVKMLSEVGNRINYTPHGPEVVLASSYDALLAERDQLKAENERLRKLPTCWSEVLEQSEANDELLDKVLELSADAERHRWLRQHEFDIGSYHGVHEHNHAAWFEHIDDEAIDRSIAEEAKFADDNEQPDQEPQRLTKKGDSQGTIGHA